MFHGIDERISTDNLVGLLTFYVDLVESVGTVDLSRKKQPRSQVHFQSRTSKKVYVTCA